KPSLSQDPQTIRWWCSGSEACIAIRSPALVGTCGSAGNMIPPSAGPKIYQQRDSFHNTNGDLCATGQFDGGTRPNLGPPPSEISWTCSGSASCEAKRIADPICGNGIKEGEEPCDTGTFPGPKCTNPLGCTDGCKFNAHCDKIGGICCCAKATLSK
ncbi:MAG: hypothetical protein NT094_00435, partial [Candidatus Staskawiczbacteria bacterium]|nr:hypothetical protein [Candidatus Staskawiczbacteria bacterium]